MDFKRPFSAGVLEKAFYIICGIIHGFQHRDHVANRAMRPDRPDGIGFFPPMQQE